MILYREILTSRSNKHAAALLELFRTKNKMDHNNRIDNIVWSTFLLDIRINVVSTNIINS